MIDSYNLSDLGFAATSEVNINTNVVGVANTKYYVSGSVEIVLPDVMETPLTSVIIVCQLTGTSTVKDETSRLFDHPEGGHLRIASVVGGTSLTFYRASILGRQQWISGNAGVVTAPGGGVATQNELTLNSSGDRTYTDTEVSDMAAKLIEESYTVANVTARDALVLGAEIGQVSPGDVVKVLDIDGNGTVGYYRYETSIGYLLLKVGDVVRDDILTVINGGSVSIPNAAAVGVIGGVYKLFDNSTNMAFIGINAGAASAVGAKTTIISTGYAEATITGTPVEGQALECSSTSGVLVGRAIGSPKYIVGFFIKTAPSGKALVKLIAPRKAVIHDIEIGFAAPLGASSTNLLAAKRTAGKFIWYGNPIYILSARSKTRIPGTTAPSLDIYNGTTGSFMFSEYVLPSLTADTYGNAASTPVPSNWSNSRIANGVEIRFQNDSGTDIGAADVTFKLVAEEEVKLT